MLYNTIYNIQINTFGTFLVEKYEPYLSQTSLIQTYLAGFVSEHEKYVFHCDVLCAI